MQCSVWINTFRHKGQNKVSAISNDIFASSQKTLILSLFNPKKNDLKSEKKAGRKRV
jgi:hypothetical protein